MSLCCYEKSCPNCDDTIHVIFDNGRENEKNREVELYGTCDNCSYDYIISIHYNIYREVQNVIID